MQAVVDGLMTHYEKTGKGQPIVLLHGWGQNLGSFSALVKDLSKKYTVLSLDLPGFGGTEGSKTAWNLDDYASFVASWLKKIEVEGVYAYVGHSHGGAVSIRGLSLGLLEAQKLVLLGSAGIRRPNSPKWLAYKTLSKTGKLITMPLPRHYKIRAKRLFYDKLGSDIGLFPTMEDTFRRIISQDLQDDARILRLPTLLVYGERDTETPIRIGRIFHKDIAGSRLEIIEGENHFVHQTRPEVVNKMVLDFLGAK